jgi:hypothetical protein
MILTGENGITRGKPCSYAILSTINSTRNDSGANPGLCDERPATNRLSYATACLNLTCNNKTDSDTSVLQVRYSNICRTILGTRKLRTLIFGVMWRQHTPIQWTQNNCEVGKRHSKRGKIWKEQGGSTTTNSLSEHV